MQGLPPNNDGQLLRGALDMVILAALEHKEQYGLEIIQHVKSRTGGHFDLKEGTLYPVLHRLEKRGALTAEKRPSDAGGPPRKYYKLTQRGLALLEQERRQQRKHISAVSAFLVVPL